MSRCDDPLHWKLPPMIPSIWKQSKFTMIYKKGEKSLPSSWRPIAGQETMEKIFSGILSERLLNFTQNNNILPVWQRATAGSDGCHECNLALDLARDAAKAQHSQLHLVWTDIHNAFGSVDRDLLFNILARFGLPATFIGLIQSLYKNNSLLYDDGQSIRAIPEIVGLKQGDPLSALLFSFYLAPAMLEVTHTPRGFKFDDTHILCIAAFADDALLFAPTAQNMKVQLSDFNNALKHLGLLVNPRKCRSLSVSYCAAPRVISDTFSIDGEEIERLDDATNIKYLGRPVDADYFSNAKEYQDNVLALSNAIADSHLFPWFKLEALSIFVFFRNYTF